jgi:hypothetical protein
MVAIGFNRPWFEDTVPPGPSREFDPQALAQAWIEIPLAAVGADAADEGNGSAASHNIAGDDSAEDREGVIVNGSDVELTVPSYYLALVDPQFGRAHLNEESPEVKQ